MGQALHRKAMDYFKEYLIVGGMPQAVLEYRVSRNFEKTDKIKRNILNLYRENIWYNSISTSKTRKKFNISALDENARYRNFEGAFY